MKIDKKILARAEYTSLGLSALGTFVTAATGQIAYTASPLICSLFLNVINRNELARRTPRDIKNQIASVENSFTNINISFKEQIRNLKNIVNNREDVEDIKQNIESLQENIKQLQSKNDYDSMRGLIALFQDNLNTLENKIDEVETDANKSIKQQELNKILTDISQSIEQKIHEIRLKTNDFVSSENLEYMIIEAFKELDSNRIEYANQQMKYINELFEKNERSAEEHLKQSIRKNELLEKGIKKLEETKSVYQKVKEELSIIESREEMDFISREELEIEINKSREQICNFLNQQIINFNSAIINNRPIYNLVYNRDGSRHILTEALKQGKERIILVCPWITKHGADDEIIELCQKFLQRGGTLSIGWGHLSDTNSSQHQQMNDEEYLEEVKVKNKHKDINFWYSDTLNKFKKLREQYPNRIVLKKLGTHEKFIVCDRLYAMIGSHNFLTSSSQSSEREIGLLTSDKNIIDELIDRFENGIDLEHKEEKDRDDGLNCLVSDLDDFDNFDIYEPVKDHNYYNCDPEELYEQPGYWADD